MLHAKFDVDLPNRPEFADMSIAAIGLLACALAYCRKYETDGAIPRNAHFLLRADAAPALAELVAAGEFVTRDRGGYDVREYLRSNESKEQILAARAGNRERKQRSRASQGPRNIEENHSHGVTSSSVTPPVTLSVTATSQQPSRVTAAGRPDSDSDSDFKISGERVQGEGPASEPEEDPRDPAYQIHYRELYAEGIKAGKGSGYVVPRGQFGDLNNAILTFAKGGRTGKLLRKERLHEWIRAMSEEFARWLVDEDRRKPGIIDFYSSFGPTGFLKWLNRQTQEGAA